MTTESDDRDVIHVSPWLVKISVAAILSGLGMIGAYMIVWALNDATFKGGVNLQFIQLNESLRDIKEKVAVVPANTQKIEDLRDRVRSLENNDRKNGER